MFLKRFKKHSIKIRLLIIFIILMSTALVASAGVFAYQVYLENTQQSQTKPNASDDDGCLDGPCNLRADKPVIYLYPEKTINIKVELEYNGKLISTYPNYNYDINGWQVKASPDGTITNQEDGNEYSYLFWEGANTTDYSKLDTGFVVRGSDTKKFLQSKLKKIGLIPKEYNEMIVYWLPKMENNRYNLIQFAGKEYTDNAKLTITPKPDSILRVFMVFKPLDKYREIKEQKLDNFERKGFSVVEWGGTEIK